MRKINKILVANRGEIAIRLFRACREMDIASVAIYSQIDREARHVRFADEALFLGEISPAAGYLNIERIIELARHSGADAVHPGYGFLAENPRFAQAVEDAGLIWIGPPPQAIRKLGDKVSARKIAGDAGVASVPGTGHPAAGPQEVEIFAAEHGWPVALKAAHGGGGRGFRVVHEASNAAEAFESAAREAQGAFGSSEIYLERYLPAPRHIEVQVLGDAHGNLLHFGERDCSLQRRHQKLVEESPSPALDEASRAAICRAAVAVAAQADYRSAGTVEFLYEETPEGPRWWFLEMNTRLQVEHPVTEMVTGIDLAKLMIRVAQGEAIPFSQNDILFRGHAIECRINAENASLGFMPSPGHIGAYEEPAGPGVRVDSGAAQATEIPETYDSLIAKLICWGSDRREAVSRTARALSEFTISGIPTTIPFHKQVLQSRWFADGKFSTRTVEQDMDLAAIEASPGGKAPQKPVHAQRVVTVEVEGRAYEVKFTEKLDPSKSRTKPAPPDLSRRSHAGTGEEVVAPMQGTIVRLMVDEGQQVSAGDPICVLEAMKMENVITCHRDGVVKKLRVSAGDTISAGAVIAEIQD